MYTERTTVSLLPSPKLTIIAIYRYHNTPIADFYLQLKHIMHKHMIHPTVILGDMNFNWFNNYESSPLRTLLNTWGYRQMITTPTTKSDTLIDHIYTNIDPTQTITSTYNTYYSDHDIISMAINKHTCQQQFQNRDQKYTQ